METGIGILMLHAALALLVLISMGFHNQAVQLRRAGKASDLSAFTAGMGYVFSIVTALIIGFA